MELLLSCTNPSIYSTHSLRWRQNGHHFADNIFTCIFFNENVWIKIKVSWNFVVKGLHLSLVQAMTVLGLNRWQAINWTYDVLVLGHTHIRARHFPLPDGPGQVKLPVGQVDLDRFFFFISYKQIEEYQNSWSRASDDFEKRRALHIYVYIYTNMHQWPQWVKYNIVTVSFCGHCWFLLTHCGLEMVYGLFGSGLVHQFNSM